MPLSGAARYLADVAPLRQGLCVPTAGPVPAHLGTLCDHKSARLTPLPPQFAPAPEL
jgi:hypothetical protein